MAFFGYLDVEGIRTQKRTRNRAHVIGHVDGASYLFQ